MPSRNHKPMMHERHRPPWGWILPTFKVCFSLFSLLYLMNVNDRNEKDSELSLSFTDAKKNLIYQKKSFIQLIQRIYMVNKLNALKPSVINCWFLILRKLSKNLSINRILLERKKIKFVNKKFCCKNYTGERNNPVWLVQLIIQILSNTAKWIIVAEWKILRKG